MKKLITLLIILSSITSYTRCMKHSEEGKNVDLHIIPAKEIIKHNRRYKHKKIIKLYKIHKYNPNAVWQDEKCKYCHGKGYIIRRYYSFKYSKNIKKIVICPHCKGKGTIGRSCK